MPTRNVVLTDHHTDLLERLVSSGRYQNASEVLREGLRLVEANEAETEARLRALRSAVQVGIADIEAGRFQSFKSSSSLRRHLTTLANEAIGEKRGKRLKR